MKHNCRTTGTVYLKPHKGRTMQAKIITVLAVTTKLNRKAMMGEPAAIVEARDIGNCNRTFIQHDERDGALAAQWLSAELNSNPAARSVFAHSVYFHLKGGGSIPSGLIHALETPEHVYRTINNGYFLLDPITPDAVQNLFRLAGAVYSEVRDSRDRLTEVIIKPLEVTAS